MSASSFAITFDSVEKELAHLKVVLAEKEEVIKNLRSHWNTSLDELDAQTTQLTRYKGLEPENKRLTEENTALRRELDNTHGMGTSLLTTQFNALTEELKYCKKYMKLLVRFRVSSTNGIMGLHQDMQRGRKNGRGVSQYYLKLINDADKLGFLMPPVFGNYSLRVIKPSKMREYRNWLNKNWKEYYFDRNVKYNNGTGKSEYMSGKMMITD